MPDTYTRVTPFGSQHGLVTQGAAMANQNAQNHDMLQAQLAAIQAQQAMASQADSTRRYGIDTGLKQYGTFGERAASDMDLAKVNGGFDVDRARINMGPAQSRADLDTSLSNEGRPLRDAESNLKLQAMQRIMSMVQGGGAMGGGSGGGAMPTPAATPNAPGSAAYGLMGPGNAAKPAAAGGGGMSQSDLELMQILGSITGSGNMPDIAKQRAAAAQLEYEMGQRKRQDQIGEQEAFAKLNPNDRAGLAKMPGIAVSTAQDPTEIEGLLQSQLPGFVDKDTSGGVVGGVKGFFKGGVPGAVVGAMGEDNASPQDSAGLQALYEQLVQAYTAQNGGNVQVARQKAYAQMLKIAQTSGQGDDALTDMDADKTRALFGGLQR